MSEGTMQVISVVSENFKKLKAISITPHGTTTVFSGSNEAGKTTACDLVWFALNPVEYAKATGTVEPLTRGEKRGFVKVELGNGGKVELVCTRKMNPSGLSVELATAEGAVLKSPQAILDALTGAISFDPMSFAGKKPEEQKKILVEMVPLGIDLAKWTADRQSIFDQRTELNRKKRDKEGEFLAFAIPEEGTPDVELKSDVILEQINEAQKVIKANAARRQELADARTGIQNLIASAKLKHEQVTTAEERIVELLQQISDLKEGVKVDLAEKQRIDSEIKAKTAAGIALSAEVDALKDPDVEDFNDDLFTLDETNKKIRAKIDRKKAKEAFEALEKESLKLTDKLSDMDADKSDAIKNAKFPVAGLGFDDNGITYNGIPFSQASSAGRLRVSLSIAMALNPRLRFLRITDGSLLDKKNWSIVEEMCGNNGYHAFIEKVDESGKVGIFIEDGEVKAVN